jgi:hypothetical protein
MSTRSRILLAAVWILSLIVVSQWTGRAQSGAVQIGQEVRFLRSKGDPAGHRGILVANFGGQWLPVKLDGPMPDGNSLVP